MNRFIKLTDASEDTTFYINANDISVFFKRGAFTELKLISDRNITVIVKEPPEHIMKQIEGDILWNGR